jgi:transposase
MMADKKEPLPERARRRTQDWTVEEKLRVVLKSMELPDSDLGAFLRREGLHEAELREWREAALEALEKPQESGKRRRKVAKRIRQLESELRRKEKALAEAAALIVLQKKVRTLWGVEGDDIDEENEK